MKADKIHISHFNFVTIEKLEIDRKVGDHATARLRGVIRDEDVEDYKSLLLSKIWVKIIAEDEDGIMRNLMVGIIAGFSLEKLEHEYVLELELQSGTCLMDGKKHFRSFQDNTLTYLDVIKKINSTYSDTGVITETSLESPIDFLLQYQETDWEFIKRLASHFGLNVTPEVNRQGIFYYIGNTYYESHELPVSASCHVSKYTGVFMKQSANGEGSLREQDYVEYQVSAREIYALWDFLTVGSLRGHIYRIHSEYRQEELINTYFLRPKEGLKALQAFNEHQAGCSFAGKVNAVMQDKVQVALTDDENSDQTITRWFPYSTGYSSPDGAGWYCMPEIGDRVRLQIPDSRENNGYVISAVHMDTENGRKMPDHKSFKTAYGKELLFTPDSLVMTNNQGMSVKIIDGEGIQLISDKDITIAAGGDMTISSQAASLIVAGTESVDIIQAGSGLHIDENIVFTGGKFRIQ